MNIVTYAILLTALLLGCLAATGLHAEENTTYNFYFQKAPGPVTVNQGGAAQAAPAATPAAAPAPVSVTVASAPEESFTPKKFHLMLGYSLFSEFDPATNFEIASGERDNHYGGQYTLRGEYGLNEKFSLMGGFYVNRKVLTPYRFVVNSRDRFAVQNGYFAAGEGPKSEKNVKDFSLGGAFNFVRLRTTTLSLLGGVVSVPTFHYENIRGNSEARDGISHSYQLYAGARLRLLADNVWGLDVSYRALPMISAGIAEMGLTFAL